MRTIHIHTLLATIFGFAYFGSTLHRAEAAASGVLVAAHRGPANPTGGGTRTVAPPQPTDSGPQTRTAGQTATVGAAPSLTLGAPTAQPGTLKHSGASPTSDRSSPRPLLSSGDRGEPSRPFQVDLKPTPPVPVVMANSPSAADLLVANAHAQCYRDCRTENMNANNRETCKLECDSLAEPEATLPTKESMCEIVPGSFFASGAEFKVDYVCPAM